MLDNVKSAPSRFLDSIVTRWQNARTFFAEVRNEMKRVTWPSRKEVYATTLVVILTSIFFGTYLWWIDLGLDRLVRYIFTSFGAA
jgi:preprotein translocase subunit SecE